MPNVHWFIESGMSLTLKGDRYEKFLEILEGQGCTTTLSDRDLWDPPVDFSNLCSDQPTILYCSIDLGKRYWKESRENKKLPKPGVWFDPELLRYRSYVSHLFMYLLNKDRGFYQFQELWSCKDEIFHKHASKDGKIFIRPEKNEKTNLFVGTCLDFNEFKHWVGYNEGHVEKEAVCVVAPGKSISNEWRVTIDQHQNAVSGCLYKDCYGLRYLGGIPEDVARFAEEVAETWSPHPVWALDIAETDDQLKVIELSTINCSGWYDSDILPIVKAINEAVLNPV